MVAEIALGLLLEGDLEELVLVDVAAAGHGGRGSRSGGEGGGGDRSAVLLFAAPR